MQAEGTRHGGGMLGELEHPPSVSSRGALVSPPTRGTPLRNQQAGMQRHVATCYKQSKVVARMAM